MSEDRADTGGVREPAARVMGPDHRVHFVYVSDGLWTGCGLDARSMPTVVGGETIERETCQGYADNDRWG